MAIAVVDPNDQSTIGLALEVLLNQPVGGLVVLLDATRSPPAILRFALSAYLMTRTGMRTLAPAIVSFLSAQGNDIGRPQGRVGRR